jgi:hypothetical protein
MPYFQWHAPLDPDCPEVRKFNEHVMNDPMTQYSGCGDEIMESFHRKHQRTCTQCQNYGAANIEVIGP